VIETGKHLSFDFFNAAFNTWYEVNLARMHDGVVASMSDVTEKRFAANLVARNYETLKETSGKLTESNTMLERSNLDLLRFASVASHDLKEPLRRIEIFSSLLQEKLETRGEPDEINYIEKITLASARMQKLIGDVLTVATLSNSSPDSTIIDLKKTLGRIIEDLEVTIREKNVDIRVGELPDVKAVEGQMHQLFQNLTANAIKFNQSEKPVVSISYKPLPKEVAGELNIDPEKYISISVKDNGIGFDEKYTDKIFGMFQRLNGTGYDGTGIGLAICKKIVDNHQGYLVANGKPNEGAEFLVVLPKHD
jgi:two-component system CheB/CheR fusion protein